MTEQANPNGKALRILLEALTTISYLKGGDGRAAAIAEYALNRYEKVTRNANTSDRQSAYYAPENTMEWGTETQSFPEHHLEQRNHHTRRRIDRRHVNSGPPAEQAERRLSADRRVNAERRGNPLIGAER